MSHFYCSMQGSRGPATRCGTKQSGHECHIRGWDLGVRVKAEFKGCDQFRIYITAGSNGNFSDVYLGTVREPGWSGKFEFIPAETLDPSKESC